MSIYGSHHTVGTLKYGWVVFYLNSQSSSWIDCWSKFSTLSSFIGSILIIVGLFLIAWGQRASGKMLPILDNQSATNPSINGLKEPLLGWEPLNFNLFFLFCFIWWSESLNNVNSYNFKACCQIHLAMKLPCIRTCKNVFAACSEPWKKTWSYRSTYMDTYCKWNVTYFLILNLGFYLTLRAW